MDVFLGMFTVFCLGFLCGSMSTVKTVHKNLTGYLQSKGRTEKAAKDLSQSILTNKYKK